MSPRPNNEDADAPALTQAQLQAFKAQLTGRAKEPLFPSGTITDCPVCAAQMVTTNNLRKTIATPSGTVVIARLPGAQCSRCDAIAFDPSALAIIAEYSGAEVVADYETSVTRASGKTLGTYFKADLTRVLGLKGKESLRWKVLDRNHVLVSVDREGPPKRTESRGAKAR